MLNKVTGDLIKLAEAGEFDCILQGCNCFCIQGSGIARQIVTAYPGAYEADKQTRRGDKLKLGTYSKFDTGTFTIINGYTQFGTSSNGEDVFEYAAFGQLLIKLAADFFGKRFGLPYIGMGLANGDPAYIMPMIELFAEFMEETGGSVTLVKFKE